MHSPRPEDLHDLNAFAGFLRLLAEEGIAPARRYRDVLALDLLPIQLARRLAPLADKPALRRFLASEAPHPEVLKVVLAAAASDDERTAIRAIVDAKRKK